MAVVEAVDVTLAKLSKALVETGTEYEKAKRAEQDASRETIRALNAANIAQREFDAFVVKLKENAPTGSNWKCPNRV